MTTTTTATRWFALSRLRNHGWVLATLVAYDSEEAALQAARESRFWEGHDSIGHAAVQAHDTRHALSVVGWR